MLHEERQQLVLRNAWSSGAAALYGCDMSVTVAAAVAVDVSEGVKGCVASFHRSMNVNEGDTVC
ncbi:hypothetical protein E2C01_054871 [Portunus trituberculatus]|uniref:Uncharacterized protein n=1 Tax=Portunus trituberculatus TaxID=210409 RepID=A0A5B7GW55_PORTR|nr:hypothetical protein [Portunus trituberculatus]